MAASPNATYVEFFPDDQVLNFRKIIDRQTEVRDGRLVLPEEPGLGFDFLPEAVAEYAVRLSVAAVTAFMRAVGTCISLMRSLDRAFPKVNTTMVMMLEDEDGKGAST